MSYRSLRKTKARRAIGVDYDTKPAANAVFGGERAAKGFVSKSVAALAISALGLGLFASASPDFSAEATTPAMSTVSHTTHDHGHDEAPVTEGVDEFGRSADDVSRGATRADMAEALAAEEDHAAEAAPAGDAPAPTAEDSTAEEAAQRLLDLAADQQKLEDGTAEAAQHVQDEEAAKEKQAEAEAEAQANRSVAPMAPGTYQVGARWGAVGAWSRYHTGIDMTAPVGTPIYAAAAGVVTEPKAGGWAGVHAVIQHDDGSSLYAHMQSTTVKPGQEVAAGDVIGYVGMTGRTFGAHLHFEFYPNGAKTDDPYTTNDPARWLEGRGVRL